MHFLADSALTEHLREFPLKPGLRLRRGPGASGSPACTTDHHSNTRPTLPPAPRRRLAPPQPNALHYHIGSLIGAPRSSIASGSSFSLNRPPNGPHLTSSECSRDAQSMRLHRTELGNSNRVTSIAYGQRGAARVCKFGRERETEPERERERASAQERGERSCPRTESPNPPCPPFASLSEYWLFSCAARKIPLPDSCPPKCVC